jgi:hypothetical protein
MALGDLDVADAEARGELVEREHAVAAIANVADRHSELPWVGASRAEEIRFLGAAAGAADAPQLEDANRMGRGHHTPGIAATG